MGRIRWFFSSVYKVIRYPGVRKNFILMLTPALFPRLHCRLRIKYKHYYPENPIDLKHPKLFNEKLLWLQYYLYNKSALVQQCYDKYLVRDFVDKQGCGDTLNTLYGKWDSMDEIPWDSLPDRCVLKASNSWSGHTFRTHGEPINPEEVKSKFLRVNEIRRDFLTEGILFAGRGKQYYICEKLLMSGTDDYPDDYKFYCFHGEPKYLLWISDRFSKAGHKEVYKNIDWTDRPDICDEGHETGEVPRPACYEEMLEIARKLSAPFPFVRVDLYVFEGKPIFSELTFAPGGTHTPGAQKELGDLIHMERMKEYKKNLITRKLLP